MPERLPGLDTVRAVGAMLVLIYHLSFYTDFSSYLTGIKGLLAVQSFFVLSAFSLYNSYFDRLNNPEQIKGYFVRRFLKIAPLFYLMIIAWGINDYVNGTVFSFGTYLINCTFLFNLVPGLEGSIVTAGWAIGVLFLFYLIFPILVFFIRRIRYAIILLVGSLLISYYYMTFLNNIPELSSFSDRSIVTQFPFFVSGLLGFLLIRGLLVKKELLQKRLVKGIGLGLMVFAIVLACILLWVWPLYHMWGVVFGCLIIGLVLYPSRVLVNRPIKFIGDRSYSIYLLHPFLILLSSPIYSGISSWIGNIGISFLISFIYTFTLVLGLSVITYRFIEQPLLQRDTSLFSKFFKNKRQNGVMLQA